MKSFFIPLIIFGGFLIFLFSSPMETSLFAVFLFIALLALVFDLFVILAQFENLRNGILKATFPFCTTLGRKIGEYISEIQYSGRFSNIIPSHHTSNKPVLSQLDTADDKITLYRKLLEVAKRHFEATCAAIIFPAALNDSRILTTGIYEGRFETLLVNHFEPYFILRTLDVFGFFETHTSTQGVQAFNSFGFKYFAAQPVVLPANQGNAIIWIGFTQKDTVTSTLYVDFKNFCEKLTFELPSVERLCELSDRISVAEQSNEVKSQAIAQISHDIRSPLNNIKAILNLIRLEGFTEETFELIDTAIGNCESVSDIVSGILDYTLFHAGHLRSNPEVLDLGKLVIDSTQNYRVAAKLKGLELKVDSSLRKFFIFADKRHVRRIFCNLLSNAIKYTQRGNVAIVVAHRENQILLRVEDTGCGISTENISKLYSPFTRFNPNVAEGIGLGLAVTKILSELNGAKINFSSSLGIGSTISVFFEKCISKDNSDEIAEAFKEESSSISVLIVDDDRVCVNSLARSLKSENLTVLKAYTVADAISLLNYEHPSALITDDSMPNGGGEVILKFLRMHNKKIPTLVITGSAESISSKLKQYKFVEVHPKPADIPFVMGWLTKLQQPSTSDPKALVA